MLQRKELLFKIEYKVRGRLVETLNECTPTNLPVANWFKKKLAVTTHKLGTLNVVPVK